MTTIALVYMFTGDLSMSMGIGALEVITKMTFYYFHERGWQKIKWGLHR